MFERYYSAVRALQSTIPKETRSYMKPDPDRSFFLERAHRFMKRLGNPERGFKVVHVTGTSGKGSTAAMIYSVLYAAGKTVGLKTSPFVTTSIENVQINGQLVDPLVFAEAVETVMPVFEEIEREDPEYLPSYSEVFFAVALVCFQKINCEWIVVEVGCGGRFDYTNVFEKKVAAVITNIGLDHTSVLGNTVEDIAWQKAGIISAECAVFSAEQKPEARRVIDTEAELRALQVNYISPSHVYRVAMPGEHQQWNAALAAAVGEYLQIDGQVIEAGIASTQMPARVEIMQEHPRVIIDGAHSFPKVFALVNALQMFRPWKRLHLVFSAKEGRELKDILSPLVDVADTVIFTSFQLPGFGSHTVEEMAEAFRDLGFTREVQTEADVQKAVRLALAKAADDDLVVITGSLYMSGFARQHWIPEEQMLRAQHCFPKQV